MHGNVPFRAFKSVVGDNSFYWTNRKACDLRITGPLRKVRLFFSVVCITFLPKGKTKAEGQADVVVAREGNRIVFAEGFCSRQVILNDLTPRVRRTLWVHRTLG